MTTFVHMRRGRTERALRGSVPEGGGGWKRAGWAAFGRRIEPYVLWLACLVFVLVAGSAMAVPAEDAAAEPRAVVVVTVGGDAHMPAVRERIGRAIHAGVVRADVAVVEGEPPACTSASCVVEAARTRGAALGVWVRVDVSDRTYGLRIFVVDAEDGGVLREDRMVCEICGLSDVAQRLEDAVATLVRAVMAEPRTGVVQVRTDPPGAQVRVDGVAKGTTPVRLVLAPGGHTLRFERPGYAPAERRVEVVPGTKMEISTPLLQLVEVGPRPWRRRAGGALVGIGASLAAPGITLLALDDRPYRRRCTGADVDADGDCRFVYDTAWGGGLLLAAGTAALSVGIVWLVESVHRARRRAPDGP